MSKLEKDFGALLRPEVQRFLALTKGSIPSIERIPHGLIVRGLPPTFNRDIAESSTILEICHQNKDLLCYGERKGKKAVKKKLKRGEALENPAIRICVAYTFTLKKAPKLSDDELDRDRLRNLTIKFWPSFCEEPTIDDRIMTDAEIVTQVDNYIDRCFAEISTHLREIYKKAYSDQAMPNFGTA